MKPWQKTAIASLVAVASGCEQQAGNATNPAPQPAPAKAAGMPLPQETPKPTDPLASFKGVVTRTRDALDGSSPVWFNPSLNKWVKFRLDVENLNYDVKKSDSLVSPYTGAITFDMPSVAIAQGEDRQQVESAAAPSPSEGGLEGHWRLTYAFQDGRWVIQAVEKRTVGRVNLSEGERSLHDSGWVRPTKGFEAEVVVPQIEGAAR